MMKNNMRRDYRLLVTCLEEKPFDKKLISYFATRILHLDLIRVLVLIFYVIIILDTVYDVVLSRTPISSYTSYDKQRKPKRL